MYEEFVDFIAHGPTVDEVLTFHPSDRSKARVAELVGRDKRDDLTPDEKAELDHHLHIEHLMRLAKAKARRRTECSA